MTDQDQTDLVVMDDDTMLVQNEPTAIAALNRSEVEAQITAAHRYPRSLKRFFSDAMGMVAMDQETAESCIYGLKRGGKTISGPSIRLAEICASAWGNVHAGARPIEVGQTTVTSQGVFWDIERNVRVTVETKRRITNRDGSRYNEDMITTTENAASSIAYRNAVFRGIPRAYVNKIYDHARRVAVGDAKTLPTRRADVLARLAKMGADQERVLHALGRQAVDDITLADLETLIGYGTSIKDGVKQVDELFPAPPAPEAAAPPEGKRMSLKSKPAEPAPTPPTREAGEEG